MRSKIIIILILIVLFGVSCATVPTKITKIIEVNYNSEPKNLVILTGTRYDPQIRKALVKNGFKVKKFSFISSIEKAIDENTKKTINQAEARFGLSVYLGVQKDTCVGNDGVGLTNTVFELSDLLTNDVLAYVEKSGWTQPCAMARVGIIWEELAVGLAELWVPTK
jgi:hypothetical protein